MARVLRCSCQPYQIKSNTGVAQLVELWSPKPGVVGSSPTPRANKFKTYTNGHS